LHRHKGTALGAKERSAGGMRRKRVLARGAAIDAKQCARNASR
jgi:hypothetical protein